MIILILNKLYIKLYSRLIILLFTLNSCNNHKHEYLVRYSTGKPLLVDGRKDDFWKKIELSEIGQVLYKEELWDGYGDVSAKFGAARDAKNIYFLIEIIDDVKFTQQKPGYLHEDKDFWVPDDYDGAELYFVTGKKESNLRYNFQLDSISSSGNITGVCFEEFKTNLGYGFEISMPLSNFHLAGNKYDVVDFEIQILDNDLRPEPGIYGGRETILSWAGSELLNFNSGLTKRSGKLVIEND